MWRASLVAQWLRIHLPMQGTRSHATTTEVRVPRACAPQQDKPKQREARALQQRVAPARPN